MALLSCAASSPVLIEPRAAGTHELRMQVGAAAIAPIGGDKGALADARVALASPAGSASAADPGTAVALGTHPGVAPVVRATVGVARDVEASVRYGGRDVGASVRWVFSESRSEKAGATTVSIGAEGRALLRGRPEDGVLGGAVVDGFHGFGGTVPLILAWQSDAGLVLLYAAALVGYDGVSARVAYTGIGDDQLRDASVRRLFGAATLGLGVGFRRVHAIVELGTERDWLHAGIADRTTDVRLWSLTPAFALSLRL